MLQLELINWNLKPMIGSIELTFSGMEKFYMPRCFLA